MLQKTPISFDVSVWELFSPLLCGARLVLARPGGHRDAAYLVDLIGRRGITLAHFVPSMLHSFLAEPDLGPCRRLRRVVTSGEALPAELARRFAERLDARLDNLYGPTEAAIEVTWWRSDARRDQEAVPIGRPVSNTAIRIVDRSVSPLPIGVAGELMIGGTPVARGYFARPGLSAERFVPDPLAATPGARLYRTGDLARHQASGEIHFLGRLDHQLKIRGFRVELGEIEEILGRHPGVREAVVLPGGGEDGGAPTHLGACLVAASAEAPGVESLREHLARDLPHYMIPARFFVLDQLPRTASGKVDRSALLARASGVSAAIASKKPYVAPESPAEERLCEIFSEVLGQEEIGVQDNFFELGGHSLAATEVVGHIRDAFAVEIGVRRLFEHPTVAQLAEAVEEAILDEICREP